MSDQKCSECGEIAPVGTSRRHNLTCSRHPGSPARKSEAEPVELPTVNEIWMVVGINCWGKGFTRATALAAAKEVYSRSLHGPWRKYVVIRTSDPWAFVDDMGRVLHRDGTTCREVERVDPTPKPTGNGNVH